MNVLLRILVISFLALCSACSTMLPSGKEVVKSPWTSFDDAQAAFDQVIPNETNIDELSELGFDPHKTPNIKILNYLDVRQLFKYRPGDDAHYHPGVVACMRAREACLSYDVDIKDIDKKRVGNFWLDVFVIKRKEHRTGWQFKALFLIVDNQVVYKLAGGSPQLDETRTKKNPLGPLQEVGPHLIE